MDLLSDDLWPIIKLTLGNAISDTEDKISIGGLKLLGRCFVNAPIHMAVEIVLLLCNQIQKLSIFHNDSDQNLEISIQKDAGLLKKFRLFNQMILEIPIFWVRLPDGLLKEFVHSTFDFLWKCDTYPTPFSVFSLIDFEANWFGKWFISCYGRNIIVPALKRDDTLNNLTRYLIRTLDIQLNYTQDVQESFTGSECIVLSSVFYLECLHLIRIFGRFLCFAQGRSLFPIEANIEKAKLKSHILRRFYKNDSAVITFSSSELLEFMLILMVDESSSLPIANATYDREKLCLNRVICDILRDISSSSVCTRKIIYKVN